MTVPATGISVAPTTVSVDVGDTTAITATLTPANATDHVTWTSYDPTIATVDSDGVVTGVSAGTVNIVGKARAFTAASSVTVTEP
ncbi:MAG TPA: Ig-like domain-containing protein [Scandinavium sp.]